jgi:transposase
MSRVPLLTEAQMRRIEQLFPISRGLRRVDDRRVISGIASRRLPPGARHPALHPSTRKRKIAIPHDSTLYRQRHRIENAFGRLKDWRRIATRYDRCAHTFFSAICIAATVIFWLP